MFESWSQECSEKKGFEGQSVQDTGVRTSGNSFVLWLNPCPDVTDTRNSGLISQMVPSRKSVPSCPDRISPEPIISSGNSVRAVA